MRNTFRYSLNCQDFINFEKFNMKKQSNIMFTFFLMVIVFFAIYCYMVFNSYYGLIFAAVFAVLAGLMLFCSFKISPKKRVNNYLKKDNSYLKTTEITITDKAIETNNLPNENEAGIVAIYPYSVMNAIYETDDYFYFFIGNEARILPKSAVPNEMKELVFKEIKNSQKCIFVK